MFCCDARPGTPHKLCVAVKTSLLLFEYDGDYTRYKTLKLPDAVMSLDWYSPAICVGFRRGYSILTDDTDEVTELVPVEKSSPLLRCVPREAEFLLRVEKVGVAVGLSGEPSSRDNLRWPEVPICLAFSFPYCVSLSGKDIMIHNIYDGLQLVQQIPFSNGSALASDGSRVLVATPYQVFYLTPVPFSQQIQSLLEKKKVGEALDLFFRTRQAGTPGYQEDLNRLYKQAGYVLLAECEFKEAFRLFNLTDIDPRDLIPLFDGLVQELKDAQQQQQQQQGGAAAGSTSTSGGTSSSSVVASSGPSGAAALAADSHLGGKSIKALIAARPPRPVGGSSSSSSSSSARMSQRTVTSDHSGAVVVSQAPAMDAAGLFAEAQLQLVGFLEKRRSVGEPGPLQDAVDTSLLKLYVVLGTSGSLNNLLSGPNNCVLAECVAYLTRLKRYHALAQLYRNKDMPSRALEIWQQIGTGQVIEPGADGVAASIDYLSTHDKLELIWTFSVWILKAFPEQGLRIFTSTEREKPLPPAQVLVHLQQHSESLCDAYLEHLVDKEHNEEERYHTQLALRYLDTVLKNMPTDLDGKRFQRRPGTEGGLLGKIRVKLLAFLKSSDHYHVPTVLARLSNSTLYDESVVLYSKLGRDDEALKILIYQLDDTQAAERYCFDHHRAQMEKRAAERERAGPGAALASGPGGGAGAGSGGAMVLSTSSSRLDADHAGYGGYSAGGAAAGGSGGAGAAESSSLHSAEAPPLLLVLLKVYLNSEGRDIPREKEALDLLERHAFVMPPAEVLEIIPQTFPVAKLARYLTRVSQHSIHRSRDLKIVKSLAKVENLNTRLSRISLQSRSVTIAKERTCPKCGHKIGDRVFATFPNGTVVHFKCFSDKNVDPVSRIDFRTGKLAK
jgi:tetratricopeptide (TPR) repeat protein